MNKEIKEIAISKAVSYIYKTGCPTLVACDKYGITYETLRYFFSKNPDIKLASKMAQENKKKENEEKCAKALKIIEIGKTLTEACDMMGITIGTFRAYCGRKKINITEALQDTATKNIFTETIEYFANKYKDSGITDMEMLDYLVKNDIEIPRINFIKKLKKKGVEIINE